MTPTTETAETLAREIVLIIWPRLQPRYQKLYISKIIPCLQIHFAHLADTQLQLEAIRELADTDSIKRMQARLADTEKALGEIQAKLIRCNEGWNTDGDFFSNSLVCEALIIAKQHLSS